MKLSSLRMILFPNVVDCCVPCPAAETPGNGKKKNYISDEDRERILQQLLIHYDGKKLPYGTIALISSLTDVGEDTVSAIWRIARRCVENGVTIDVRSKK